MLLSFREEFDTSRENSISAIRWPLKSPRLLITPINRCTTSDIVLVGNLVAHAYSGDEMRR